MIHLKARMQRQIEDQVEDEKHAVQLQLDEMQMKMKRLQVKNEQLQALLKKNKQMEQRQGQFCN